MPGFVMHAEAVVTCFHQAPAKLVPAARVLVSMLPVATVPALPVAGCLFQIPIGTGTKPQPCVKIQWANISARVKVLGQPLLLQAPPGPGPGGGVCQSIEQIPQGAPIVNAMQVRVSAM